MLPEKRRNVAGTVTLCPEKRRIAPDKAACCHRWKHAWSPWIEACLRYGGSPRLPAADGGGRGL